jgi:pimeloyl-ACP methyl ester carboxylesterase
VNLEVDGKRVFAYTAAHDFDPAKPTVVFVHGWINDASVPHVHATGVSDRLVDDFRVCLYDRRNVGSSETVDAVQTPADVVRDMHAVLQSQ